MNLILAFCLASGQLLKVPFLNLSLFDLLIILLSFWGLFKLRHPIKPPLFISLGLSFFIWGIFSLLLSPLNLSFDQLLNSAFYGLRFLLLLFLGYLVYLQILPLKLSDLKVVLLGSGLAVALLGILQFIFFPNLAFLAPFGWDPHLYRLASTFLDPNFTGAYLSLTLIMIFLSLKKNNLKKYLFFKVVFLALLLTFSRSAYISFSVSFLIISLLLKSVKTLALTILLIFILFFGFSLYQKIIAQPNNVDRTKSAETRLTSWQQGLAIFQQNPLTGVGFNSYRYGLDRYQLASAGQIQSHGGSSNDSSLLHILATTGIIGLLIYLIFLFQILKIGWKNFKQKELMGMALIACLLGLLAQSFFVNTLFFPTLIFWIIVVAAALETRPNQSK